MEAYLLQHPAIILLLIFWVLPWKGVALYRAARAGDKAWFIALLLLQTLALLEIYYLYFVHGRRAQKPLERDEHS